MYRSVIFRHGQSTYRQGNDERDEHEAHDLCATTDCEGVDIPSRIGRACAQVRTNTMVVASLLNTGVPIKILSSPTGRTMHTGKIIKSELLYQGFTVDTILPVRALGEMHNFSWDLFGPLVWGGVVSYSCDDGLVSFRVLQEETNPSRLVCQDYFMTDAAHLIPTRITSRWPESYRQLLENLERFTAVTARALSYIKDVLVTTSEHHVIFVTHDGIVLPLVKGFTYGAQRGLDPGSFLTLARHEKGHLIVTRVGNHTDGDCETDFFARYV